tara:strand:- start:2401 stop:2649 length:249 start_codon:yes stop_codon:yes gene_type:complete
VKKQLHLYLGFRHNLKGARSVFDSTPSESFELVPLLILVSLFAKVHPAETLEAAQNDIRKRTFPEVATFWDWISQLLAGKVR